MDLLFPSEGPTVFGITVLAVQLVSVLLLCAILFEFWRVHRNRMQLLRSLGIGSAFRGMLIEQAILSALYIVTTILVIVLPLLFFF